MDLNKCLILYKGLDNITKKLCKDAKRYEDFIFDVTRCEKKVTTDLSNSDLCHFETKLRELIEEWYTYISKANKYDEDLMLVTDRTLVEPLKKFQGVFNETKSAVKKRDQASQECIKATLKVQKLQEKDKTGQNLVKLENARKMLINLEEDYKTRDTVLKSEMPLLYEGRIEYFQPCLEALIKAQVEHSGNSAKSFRESIQCLENSKITEGELQHMQKERFSMIRSLSIVGEK